MPSRLRALFALPFAAMALAAPHPSVAARLATPKPVAPTPGAVSESLRSSAGTTGKGLRVGARRTTRAGTATFTVRTRKGLSIVFRAVKTGFDPASITYRVR